MGELDAIDPNPAAAPGRWRLFVDTGGTFTDCLAVDPDGTLHRAKVLSSGVVRRRNEDGTLETVRTGLEAPLLAAHAVTGTPIGAPLPPCDLRLATTRGTNALLTRSFPPPVLVTNTGLGDIPRIGTQQRPDLFAPSVCQAPPLHGPVLEIDMRRTADGTLLVPLDANSLRNEARKYVDAGHRTAAVSLLHGWRHPDDEATVAGILRDAGFERVSTGSSLAPLIHLLSRTNTAVVDAALAPVMDTYLDNVSAALAPGSTLLVSTSAGGLVPRNAYHPKDSLLSGPAGGVVGAAAAGWRSGFTRCIAFDMGGTSTDVARIANGNADRVYEHKVGDATLLAPALAIESVAAGGGSICQVDSRGRLTVGPQSAGADPGPACYGMGGPLTVTDVNLLLGRLDPGRFGIPVDVGAAEAAFEALADHLAKFGGGRPGRDELLLGLVDLADEAMADAIRSISVRRGVDPRDHALVAFGGAGGMHAAAVAAKLGIAAVVVPADAGLLSAWGLAHAQVERHAEAQVLRPLASTDVDTICQQLENQARGRLVDEGADYSKTTVARRVVRLRLAGQETALDIEPTQETPLETRFRDAFETLYGYPCPDRTIEVESVRVSAVLPGAGLPIGPGTRGGIAPGDTVPGPIVVAEPHGTTFVPDGWTATVDPAGALVLRRFAADSPATRDTAPEAVELELFTRRFEAIASDMGEQLRRTALSVNVKERLDYSCALLDPAGNLVATAAHIPVHLGALGACVRRIAESIHPAPGTDWVVNHPAWGGSHLPDVTVVSPVHDHQDGLLGWVASRAHHAEIGGSRPGSMPPSATRLVEEGVVIAPMRFDRDTLAQCLRGGEWPSRAVDDNMADLDAQRAANRHGAAALRELARAHGAAKIASMQARLSERASELVQAVLRDLGPGTRTGSAQCDDGWTIRVSVDISEDGRAVVDFAGSSAAHPGNRNTPPAVVRAAVLFVLRMLVDAPVALSDGLLAPVEIRIPEGSFLNPGFPEDPRECPAVVGGNTEVSQKVAEALVDALGIAADSQGTMNNVLFGNARFGYYETVCGGAGATATHLGASAVHTHMTNTRITDPEILESRAPVRVWRFGVRRGSGGDGKFAGGDGVVRELEFLEPLAVSVLAGGRMVAPRGRAGGGDGVPGRQVLIRTDGTQVVNPAAVDALAGDRLLLETPGGGGWGTPTDA